MARAGNKPVTAARRVVLQQTHVHSPPPTGRDTQLAAYVLLMNCDGNPASTASRRRGLTRLPVMPLPDNRSNCNRLPACDREKGTCAVLCEVNMMFARQTPAESEIGSMSDVGMGRCARRVGAIVASTPPAGLAATATEVNAVDRFRRDGGLRATHRPGAGQALAGLSCVELKEQPIGDGDRSVTPMSPSSPRASALPAVL